MKKASSSSSSSSSSSWKLKRVVIENFKSINNADVNIDQGFTSIFGPNGSGKSCLLEAIVFALGASLNNMRVDTMNQIKSTAAVSSMKRKSDDNDSNKVLVVLYFTKDNITKEISNSIIGNQRQYTIDKKKYGKAVFLDMVSTILGFPRGDSFSYYISQKAVQSITQSTPKNLFQIISFSAGTHAIIEVRDNALKKLTEYENQLKQIEMNIVELDADINLDQKAFQLLQNRTDITMEIKTNAITLSRSEELYKKIKSLSTLQSMQQSIESILAMMSEKDKEEAAEAEYNSTHDINIAQSDKLEEKINDLDNELLLLRKTDALQSKQLRCKEEEEAEGKSAIASMEKELIQLECTLTFQRSQREELINSKIPGLFLRIDSLTKNVIRDDADPVKLMNEKKKNLADVNDVYRYTESLLMALTDTALHDIKEQTLDQNKVIELELSLSQAASQLKDCEDEMATLSTSAGIMTLASLTSEIQDVETIIRRDTELLNSNISSLENVMKELGIESSYNANDNIATDGDKGYLADVLNVIMTKNADNFIDSVDMLIRPHLGVRIVTTRNVAIEIMKEKSTASSQAALRIWPLDSISSMSERSPSFESYIRANNDIVDPKTFLDINRFNGISDDDSNRLIFRIIDTWIFAKSNKTVVKVLEENKKSKLFRGIITSDGLRHTYGSITVCKTSAKNKRSSILHSLRQFQQLRQSVSLLSSSLKTLVTDLENKRKLMIILTDRRRLKDSIAVMKEELNTATSNLATAEKKVTVIRLEVAKTKGDLTVLEDQRSQLINDIDALSSIKNSVGLHQQQHKLMINSAQGKLKELEKQVSELGSIIMTADNDYNEVLNNKDNTNMKLDDIIVDIQTLTNAKNACNNRISDVIDTLKRLTNELEKINGFKSNSSFNENIDVINENLQIKIDTLKGLLAQEDDNINAFITSANIATITNKGIAKKLLVLVIADIDRISSANDIDLTDRNAANFEITLRRELIVLRENSKTLVQRQIENNNDIKRNTSALITSTNSKKKRRKRKLDDDDDDDEFEYARVAVSEKRTKVSAMKDRFDVTSTAVRILSESLGEIAIVIARIQMSTFELVRKRTLKYFSDLVPNKIVDLVLVDKEIKDGISFILRDSNNNSRSIHELSGGQQSLLSLSFIIANAIHKQAPFYLLDEVDAALDEKNQQAIATIIQNIFGSSQVLCVSHHQCFLDQAAHGLSVIMKNNASVITKA